jgi:glycosyltransferase involved in cell wall biosynthesis
LVILIATVRIPFVYGGAEILAEGLRRVLIKAGHRVEIVAIPFKPYPPQRILDQMLASKLLDLTEAAGMRVDRLIGLKFPAYLIPHPRKVIWMIHQHRQAYDLWRHPLSDLDKDAHGEQVRAAIQCADRELNALTGHVFAISQNVADRLRTYCGVDARRLYHPPEEASLFYRAPAEDFLYFPSRINPLKRQDLILEALALTRSKVRVCFSGPASEPAFERKCQALVRAAGLAGRVEWLGMVSSEAKRDLYARSLGVVFPPVDEDYGYITLEAMLARKPVVTCQDSGGPLEFVADHQTGIVAEPRPAALAEAMDELWEDRPQAAQWGEAGRARYGDLDIGWDRVVENLLA